MADNHDKKQSEDEVDLYGDVMAEAENLGGDAEEYRAPEEREAPADVNSTPAYATRGPPGGETSYQPLAANPIKSDYGSNPSMHISASSTDFNEKISPMLIIGNLTWYTTDQQLENLLSRFGKIVQLNFVQEKSNGKSKGIACVQFATAEAARAAKEQVNGLNINGNALTVFYATQIPGALKSNQFNHASIAMSFGVGGGVGDDDGASSMPQSGTKSGPPHSGRGRGGYRGGRGGSYQGRDSNYSGAPPSQGSYSSSHQRSPSPHSESSSSSSRRTDDRSDRYSSHKRSRNEYEDRPSHRRSRSRSPHERTSSYRHHSSSSSSRSSDRSRKRS